MPRVVNGENHFLPRGAIYFDPIDCGLLAGELFLGNCNEMIIEPQDEVAEAYSGVEADSPLVDRTIKRRNVIVTVKGLELSKELLALNTMGDVSALAQGTSTVTNEAIADVLQGRWYKTQYRNISSVVVTGSNGSSPVYTLTTDYLVDATTGRIYIVEGGTIADGTDIAVDYSYGADTSPIVNPMTKLRQTGKIRYIGAPAQGPTYEYEFWKVDLRPDGGIGLIGDDYGTWSLRGSVIKDTAGHPTCPYYRIIKRAD